MVGTIDRNEMRQVTKSELNYILDPQEDLLSDEFMYVLNEIDDSGEFDLTPLNHRPKSV